MARRKAVCPGKGPSQGWLRAILVCGALLFSASRANGQVKLYTFPPDEIPAHLLETAMQVQEGNTSLRLTFAGDCTLGGQVGKTGGSLGFDTLVETNGPGYPFAQLQELFATDDCTVVNLEGVLSDSREDKAPGKKFNFIGKASHVDILTAGSVEGVSLANNHSLDYGQRGYRDTRGVLTEAGIAYFGEDTVTVLEKEGVRIGFTGSFFAMTRSREQRLKEQMQALESVGCQWVIHSLHGGEEYEAQPTSGQRSAAEAAVRLGAGLVVGHHPHVVQGIESLGGTLVVYSLGNCSFGGNLYPRDYDGCLLRVTLGFAQGERQAEEVSLHPIRISGAKGHNNYQPILLKGEEAQRVITKMQSTSTVQLSPYQEGQGALVEMPGDGGL